MTASHDYLSSIPDLMDWKIFADRVPHDIFDYLREHAPVFGQPIPGGGTVWSLTRAEDIRAVAKDYESFSNRRGPNLPLGSKPEAWARSNILYNDPPYHTRLRSFAAKAFSPKVVAQFDGWIREICVNIVERVAQNETIDAIPLIAAELPAMVIATVMGIPKEHRGKIVRWAQDIFGAVDERTSDAQLAALQDLTAYLQDLRLAKRREPGADMTTELDSASFRGEPITDEEYDQLTMAITGAGFETTHTLIAHTLILMSQRPDFRRTMEEGGSEAIVNGVEEVLRYASPVRNMKRDVTRDTEINGQPIKQGDIVLLWYPAGNRDPALFDNPNMFDPTRFPNPHMSFGAGGPHFCIGNHLARLEVKILLEEMIKRGLYLELIAAPTRAPGVVADAIRTMPMSVSLEKWPTAA